MCGIFGFIQAGQLDESAIPTAYEMARAIAHRGPDDAGVWLDREAGIALGHRRLAVVDLSPTGHQPMCSESGRYVLTFNGEIYNFGVLRAELEEASAAPLWRGTSDTEVLLACIEQWGVRTALERINGMFAFAVWDRERRILTLARDRMGEKPLFYGPAGGAFLFGSELKALRKHPDFHADLDLDSVADMLRLDYIPAPFTVWRGIAKLPAGHFVEVGADGKTRGPPSAYWSLRECAVNGNSHPVCDESDLASDLESLIVDSIRMRMVADVPIGAFLSSGIDSSLIVALMQEQSSRPIQTFTIGFDEPGFDEAPEAHAIATYLGTDHTELYITPQESMAVVSQLPIIWDEPFGDSSQIPTFLISHLTRQTVTVALSGDGGDELFAGYSRYRKIRREWRAISSVPAAARAAIARTLRHDNRRAGIATAAGRAARMISCKSFEDLYRWRIARIDAAESLVLGTRTDRAASIFPPLPFLQDPVEKMLYTDALIYLPEDILTKVDRASMAVSLEVRAPFLDHRIVEYAWRLPMSQRLSGPQSKVILRSIARRHLPSTVLDQPKMGFSFPVERWLRGPLKSWAEDLLSEGRLFLEGILDVPAVRSLWDNFLAGKQRHDNVIWNLLMFQCWLETAR